MAAGTHPVATQHSHCQTCIKVAKCSFKSASDECCEIVSCELECGARFHACKRSEHCLLCPYEKVACISAVIGCPVQMLRHQLGRHLSTCPASVVHCTMEWNRWPLHTYDHQPTHPPQQLFSENELDVALALRDQRMLQQLWHAPKRTCRTLRNSLTEKYPPVPLNIARTEGSLHTSMHSVFEEPQSVQQGLCGEELETTLKCTTSCPSVQVNGHCDPKFCDVPFTDHDIISEGSSLSAVDFPVNSTTTEDCSPFANLSVQCPAAPPLPSVSLGLDLNLESITRYQVKPKSMYTFLCAQEFRRDEYSWHYKNVHSDIHSGLNGWLEQRCPLAQYGCAFSRKRFHPAPQGCKIVHSNIVESFGIQPPVPSVQLTMLSKKSEPRRAWSHMDKALFHCRATVEVVHKIKASDDAILQNHTSEICSSIASLTQLPFEVLQHIARYLDGFSLCNLALTCRTLREVCCSLLDERGIVVLHWERSIINNRPSWHVAYKRWFFSTAFTPIQEWHFSDDSNMSSHLQTCRFFRKNMKTDPYFYPLGAEPNMHIYQKLKNTSSNTLSDPADVTKL